MTLSVKIVVVGAGYAGLSTAIALSKKGHELVVLEATKEFQNSGGILTFRPNASVAWRATEFTRNLLKLARWRLKFNGFGSTVAKLLLKFPVINLRKSMATGLPISCWRNFMGTGWWSRRRITVVRPTVHSVLRRAAKKVGIEIRVGFRVKAVDEWRPSVTLQDGTTLEADLIVAADGTANL